MGGIGGYFWIDTLCINQSDNDERSSQVRLMYDVYSGAREVVAWTGRPSEDSHHMIQLLSLLQQEFRRMHNDKTPFSTAAIANIKGCEYPSTRWDALAVFLQRPIFRRVWIVQELVAAKFIKLMCSVSSLDWMEFAQIIVEIFGTGLIKFLQSPDKSKHEATWLGAEGVNTTFILRCHHKFRPTMPPFSYILNACRGFLSTDPRDKIFALLNISFERSSDLLIPDYNKSVEVFGAVTRHFLTRKNPLLALLSSGGIGYDRTLTTIPSWIPDWTNPNPSTSFGANDNGGHNHPDPYYACGKDYKLIATPTFLDLLSIRLKGRVVDIVRSYHNERPSLSAQASDLENNFRTLD